MYVIFIDADDYIAKDTLRKPHQKAVSSKADIVFYDFVRFYGDNNTDSSFKTYINLDPSKTYTRNQLSRKIFNIFPILVCNKLIKINILKKNQIRFKSEYLREEDVDFSIRATLHARRFAYLDYEGYFYRVENLESETSTNYSHPTELLRILIDLNKLIVTEQKALKRSFDNYAIEKYIVALRDKKVIQMPTERHLILHQALLSHS